MDDVAHTPHLRHRDAFFARLIGFFYYHDIANPAKLGNRSISIDLFRRAPRKRPDRSKMEMAMSLTISSSASTPSPATTTATTTVSETSTTSRSAETRGSTITDVVTLSNTAQQLLSPSKTQGLVFDSKGALYNGKRIALSDIMANTDKIFTDKECQAASRHLNQMEAAGFWWTNTGATDPASLKNFFQTYKKYIESLPPEEQNSQRYKGQIQIADQEIATFNSQIAAGNTGPMGLRPNNSTKHYSLLDVITALVKPRPDSQHPSTSALTATGSSGRLPAFALKYKGLVSQPRRASDVLDSPEPDIDPISMGVAAQGTVRVNA